MTEKHEAEKARLAAISADTKYSAYSITKKMDAYERDVFLRYYSSGSVLKVGVGECVALEKVIAEVDRIDFLDGDPKLCEKVRNTFPENRVFCCLAEEFEPECAYDNIYMGNFLEHVSDPDAIVSKAVSWLAPEGQIFASVPSAMSIHRQAATIMGMIPQENALNERDISIGHRRVFFVSQFHNCLRANGLEILYTGGYYFKPFSDAQMVEIISPEGVDAFMKLGERYPDLAAEMFAVAVPVGGK